MALIPGEVGRKRGFRRTRGRATERGGFSSGRNTGDRAENSEDD